jgi:hypothetical protein
MVFVHNAFVGRRAELEAIDSLVQQSARRRCVSIEGEASIGRSRLLHAAAGTG